MGLRYLAHDREPQPAAFDAGSQHAVETLEDAAALVFGNAGTVIFYGEDRASRFRAHAHRHLSAWLGIADRVVEQVVQHLAEQERIAFDVCALRVGVESQIDVALERARYPLRRRTARERLQVDMLGRLHTSRGRFRTRERQELVYEVSRLLGRVAELLQRVVRFARRRLSQRELRLGLEPGNRRSQLMSRVGDEALLRRECEAQAIEELVHRTDERPHLLRRVLYRQR
jgi:hypothetical protein